jgi:hypothetical protein
VHIWPSKEDRKPNAKLSGGGRHGMFWKKKSMPVEDLKIKLLRGSINDIKGEYTLHGWMIDYSEQAARAVIIDTEPIGSELRKLRRGQRIRLKLQIEQDGNAITTEYDGLAEVQMVRFRAMRKELPHFRVQFKFVA